MENPVILETRNITKDFPGVRALDSVSFQLKKGEVLGLVGENGAGKSTLMKIFSGAYPSNTYTGEIFIEGKRCVFNGPKDSQGAGIAIIYQELNLIPELTVAENIFLGREPTVGKTDIIDRKKLFSRAKDPLGLLNIPLPAQEQIKNLSIGKQQMVEIAKALSYSAKILILDEPTSALTEQEVEVLLKLIDSLRARGVSMIYISHKLDEIFKITDSVTVMRDGKTVASRRTAELSRQEMVSLMVGRNIEDMYPKKAAAIGEAVLEVKDLFVSHPFLVGEKVVKEVSFKVRKGEVLGISGLMGSGRSELVTSIFGAFPADSSGEVYVEGKRVRIRSPYEAINYGLGLVTEDRKLYGLVLGMQVGENITLTCLEKLSWHQIIMRRRENELINKYIGALRVKTRSSETVVNTLSGGNQQKVVIAKWLATGPKVLLLDEPTRGVDVAAKAEIYQLMDNLAGEGLGIVMVSSDLPEVLSMSDRILIMHEGRMVKELQKNEATQEKIMFYATGGK
ncbi:MAG: sugar ABC transporter ATP-binding protein [Candidatus Omnitrophica bacterium]|nr:sugar ABC transporter ATP-binding protein [Candidatus Omnitrophota bacterium]